MQLKKIICDASPDFALNIYRNLRKKVEPIKLAAPVVQMYINDGDIETTAGFNNFLSFLAAEVKASGKLKINLRDMYGNLLLDQSIRLSHFENRFIDIKTLLAQRDKKSPLGLISLMFVPDHMRTQAYKRLGILSSHFFMFYKGSKGAVAMVHPSSTVDPISPPSGPFLSNQIVETLGLEAVTLYQCNPSLVSHELNIGLRDAQTDDVICSKTIYLPTMGVCKISFLAGTDFPANGHAMRVFTSSLPTSNSKPMLCRCYSGGRFSMSHS